MTAKAQKTDSNKSGIKLTAAEQKELNDAIEKYDKNDPLKPGNDLFKSIDRRKAATVVLRKYALRGDTEAEFRMGDSCGTSSPEGGRWYEKAAAKGHIRAQLGLGRCYLYGWSGIKKDVNKALYWLTEASSLEGSWFNLGLTYEILKDYDNAIKWYQKDVACGGTGSFFCLGRTYEKIGDYVKAAEYYQMDIDRNDKILTENSRKGLERVKELIKK